MFFVRKGFIAKQMEDFEAKNAETICPELTIVKKNPQTLTLYKK